MDRDRVRAAYDALADLFAERYGAMPTGVAEAAAEFLAAVGPGARVLDLGCGHGRDAAWLAARGADVVGADLSPGMLAQFGSRTDLPAVECDLRVLPFADGGFRGVWCNAALLHVPKADAPAALAEARRVLVPEGVLYLGLQQGDEEAWEPTTWVDGHERFFARYRAEEIGRLLDAAGFAVGALRTEVHADRSWLRVFSRRM